MTDIPDMFNGDPKMNLAISFSGGRTSAFMTKWMLDNKRNDYGEIVVTFANTGQENEETLKFVAKCDLEWGFNTVWLEAVVNPEKGKGTSFRVVNYETASRNGEPFEEMIKKYGIPNKAYPHCTRELKLQPMKAYLSHIGWKKGEYKTAIGIRSDEMDRVSSKMSEENLLYPLIEFTKPTKTGIDAWWAVQKFNLNLKEHQGSCKWCWKKSDRKLFTLIKEDPGSFEFPERMEALYGLTGHNIDGSKRTFFRGGRSTAQMKLEAKNRFKPFVENKLYHTTLSNYDYELDSPGGCSESCEVY